MLRNYLLVSFRTIKRHFTYSAINILGLTLGLASVMVIGTWVYQEYSYDRHFDNADQIHRVGVNFFNVGDMAVGPVLLKKELKNYPKVSAATSLGRVSQKIAIIDEKEVTLEDLFETDDSFFEVFSYEFTSGNPQNVLDQPHSAVITETYAESLFGTSDALGRTFEMDNNVYSISGVVREGGPSHIPAQLWIRKDEGQNDNNWLSASDYIYAKVEGTDSEIVLDQILQEINETKVFELLGGEAEYEEWENAGLYYFLPLKITDIHLRSTLKFEISPVGNLQKTQVFAGIALLILVLASINFVNITTARASLRAKEVGIRKTLGSQKRSLLGQFLLESILIFLIASFLGMILGQLFLEAFEQLTGMELLESVFVDPIQALLIIGVSIGLGTAVGLYPAFYISGFQPIKALKGAFQAHERGVFRSGLVLFQFVISISLLIVALFVYKQLSFIQNKDLGFDTSNVMVIKNIKSIEPHRDYLKQELEKSPQVISSSYNFTLPADQSVTVQSLHSDSQEKDLYTHAFFGDEDMVSTLGYRLLLGRDFDGRASDTASVILNESAVKALELKNPLGAKLNGDAFTVIGVVSDFNFESMEKTIQPVGLYQKEGGSFLSVKFSGSNPQDLIQRAQEIWAGFNANKEFDYYFLDENFSRLVEKEKILSKSLLLFNLLAMIISCLGLYGLSAFVVERKVKEIGIRRVLGATIMDITTLLSRSFAKPIMIAFLLAIPLSFYFVDGWLANYAYRVNIDPWLFLVAGFAALVIGLVTVSWQTVRTALRKPVESLRDE